MKPKALFFQKIKEKKIKVSSAVILFGPLWVKIV